MKNIVLFFISVLLFYQVNVLAQSTTMTIGIRSAADGETADLPLTVTNFNNIGAISLKISFDNTVLTFIGIENPPANVTFNVNASDGTLLIGWFDETVSSPININNGKLIDLIFKSNGKSSPVNFVTTGTDPCDISDENGNDLSIIYTNGGVTAAANNLPLAVTESASDIAATTADITGGINPEGISTTVQFDYGTTTSYGTTVTASQSPVNGTIGVSVSSDITGLTPNTLYHYRVKATNSAGTSYGADSTFTTLDNIPNAVQLISPLNGSAGNAQPVNLKWFAPSGAAGYRLQLSTDNLFSAVLIDTTGLTDTTFAVGGLSDLNIYYWRVNATNPGGTSAWSQVWSFKPLITGISSNNNGIPVAYELSQNYPNPFNPSTVIGYALPFSSNVKIEVYNTLGQKVRELLNGQKPAGYFEVNFNTAGLTSGVYLYRIQAKSIDGKSVYVNTKKMMFLK